MHRVFWVACAALGVAAVVVLVTGGRADSDDYAAADRICEPALLEDELDDANEAEVLQVAVQASAVPPGWTTGELPGRRSDVRPVADASVALLDVVTTDGTPPPEVGAVDRRREELASACRRYLS